MFFLLFFLLFFLGGFQYKMHLSDFFLGRFQILAVCITRTWLYSPCRYKVHQSTRTIYFPVGAIKSTFVSLTYFRRPPATKDHEPLTHISSLDKATLLKVLSIFGNHSKQKQI